MDDTSIRTKTNVNSTISLALGVLGWLFGIIAVLVESAFSAYDPNSRFSYPDYVRYHPYNFWALTILTILSWVISLILGNIGRKQSQRNGLPNGDARSRLGVGISGVGCALVFSFSLFVLFLVSMMVD